MRKKNKHNFFKGGGSFYIRGIFSGSVNQKVSPALNSLHSVSTAVKYPKIDSPTLSQVPKNKQHFILHYLFMQKIKAKETGAPLTPFPNCRHRYFLITYYKSFQLVSRLKGAALCLVKTKYAIKPKNPV